MKGTLIELADNVPTLETGSTGMRVRIGPRCSLDAHSGQRASVYPVSTKRGPRVQNSRHGEKIHAIATGREHRCSGWAGLHRRRSTACGLRKRGVNADAGSEFIAPSSQHPSHMPLHLERPGGAETVARQQPWSNREPPMSGVLGPGILQPSTLSVDPHAFPISHEELGPG